MRSKSESQVAEACAAALARYRDAIHAYWPAVGRVDVTEASVVANLAAEFSRRGCHVFAAPQVHGAPTEHVDFLALAADATWAAVIEAKRLYSAQKGESLGRDADRLLRIRLPRKLSRLKDTPRCFVGLVASAWNGGYFKWWESTHRGPMPQRARTPKAWESLYGFLAAAEVGYVDTTRSAWGEPHRMLFAIRELERGAFWQ